MTDVVKQYSVMDRNGHSMQVDGYQQANQLALKYLNRDDVALIVIRVSKGKQE